MSYKDWGGAAANVSKAAELLHFFIDKKIGDQVPFDQIKYRAHKLLKDREIESLCLYLNKQKRAKNDYIWEYYDQHQDLMQQLIRPLFLCLTFEGSDNLISGSRTLISINNAQQINVRWWAKQSCAASTIWKNRLRPRDSFIYKPLY